MQRHLVARAGLPRWLDLPLPFAPHPGRQLAAVRVLASQEYGLLEPSLADPVAYQLTVLGEVVAGIWLTAAFGDPGEFKPPAGPSFMPSRYR
jgi:hypothetical protein